MQKGYMENCTSLHLQVVWPRHRSSRCHNKHRERKPLVKAPKKLQQQQGTMGRHSPKGSYQRLKRQKGQRQKPPNTALKHMLSFLLPRFCIRFLWSQPDEFRVAKFFLGAGLGSLFALGLSEVLIFPMSITEDHKIQLMYGMAGVSALGWGTSPHFRCSSLLVVPKFLGREGRVYILTYVLASIYDGPVANVRHNLGEVVRSISCTVELQIENVKRSWKVSLAPLRKVLRDMVMSGQILRAENKDVSRSFAALNAQVASQEGYSARRARAAARKGRPSTQEAYETKTRMRCTYIIRKAIVRCQTWFSDKHRSCMRTIAVPLVSHLLCLPMKFSFLCHLAQIMHTWCRNKIPVEGNFGQTYDRVNGSIDNLNQDFSATLVVKEEQQAMLVGANLSHRHLVDDVNEQITQNSRRFSTVMSVLRVLLSCTFVFIFASAYSYTNSYNQDIRFDNLYISRYFRLIDARRRKQKKRTLLPLRRAERSGVIDPYRLRFQPAESKNVMLELLGCMPTLVFLLLVCSLDSLLYTVFNTIRHHSFVEYSFRSSHHLEVKVGGQTMMARLLRSTIGALNTSSETAMEATNVECLPEVQGMTKAQYVTCAIPLGVLILLCFVQVYVYRLRRVIAAFYFPKREKKRILFLYNEMLRQRMAFVVVQRKRIIQRARQRKRLEKPLLDRVRRWLPFLQRFLRQRCILCSLPETRNSCLCPNPDCGTLYCRLCWQDMGQVCFACSPDDLLSDDDSSEGQTGYAD
ncbi:E3 ubiquitin-protein ligase DCST1 isoform X2 [Hemicordylus capensis]|uniref:E3 ubiquitin-protein ligase DCST1 isoform X2 n=1 Tax=Hemicordylus capensis TaxID=884348 RepID=UPI00230400CF|nr:E3 ubiquitin-protein ligase DCST1 isoform X2 [Hemicordylus capensis]